MASASIEIEEQEIQNMYKKFIDKSLTTTTSLSTVDKEYITKIMMRKFNDEREQMLRRLIVMSKIMSGVFQEYPINNDHIARMLFIPFFNERLPLKSILLVSDNKFEWADYLIRSTRKDSDEVAETIDLINYLLTAINKRCSVQSIQACIYGHEDEVENWKNDVNGNRAEKTKKMIKMEEQKNRENKLKNLGRKVTINVGNEIYVTNKNIILSVIFTDDSAYRFILSWVDERIEDRTPRLFIKRLLSTESKLIDYIPYIDSATLNLI